MSVVSARLDAEADAALELLGDTYGNRSDTLKTAILHLAEEKRRADLRAESLAAANDPDDRAEMMAVLREMEALGEG